MASNKWLNDMSVLKVTTDNLRNTLSERGVQTSPTDNLTKLVSKVHNLAPIELSDGDRWQPDPLWVFPDPNGSGELKTIRQIYDEDTLASSYTYRGIYQISADMDTFDLKLVLRARTNADTFILSDGTIYTDISTATLVHTWDSSKDIVDSNGNRMRYVRVYSNTSFGYLPSFYGQTIWAIHNLGSSISPAYTSLTSKTTAPSDTDIAYNIAFNKKIQCCENYASVNKSAMSYIHATAFGFPIKKVVTIAGVPSSTSSNKYFINSPEIKELILISAMPYVASDSETAPFIARCFKLNYLEVNHNTTISSGSTNAYISSGSEAERYCAPSFIKINDGIKTVTLSYLTATTKVILPETATTVTINALSSLEELIIPASVTSFTLKGWTTTIMPYNLKRLVINASNLSTFSVSLAYAYNLREIVLPEEFNFALDVKYCPLTHDSIVNMLYMLKDLTGDTAKTLTLGTTNLEKLTDEEKAIATEKNWTLA